MRYVTLKVVVCYDVRMFKNKIIKRILPLYVSSFFQGLVFWYAIEKVFMVSIGFTPTSIAIQIMVMASTGLLFEIPSGILADKWSRKGVLVLSCASLGLASLLAGLSNSVLQYTLASILFGMYFALHSGTYDAMIYDTLIEEQGSRKGFEKYLGNATLIASIGLVIGSLFGAVIGEKFGLASAYLWSVPASFIAVIAAISFKEPKLHKATARTNVLLHTKSTLQAVFKKGYMAWIVMTLLATSIMYSTMLELDQLWPLALNLRLTWYGPLNAGLLLAFGLGAPLAALLLNKKYLLPVAYLSSLICVYLLTVRSMPIIALAQCGVIVLYIALYTIALGKFHDSLPSHLRSSSSSVINTAINIIFIPFVLIFGYVTQRHSVFYAAYLLVPFAVLSIIGVIIIFRRPNTGTNIEHIKKLVPVPNTLSN